MMRNETKTNRLTALGLVFLFTVVLRVVVSLFAGWLLSNTSVDRLVIQLFAQFSYIIPALVYVISAKERVTDVIRVRKVSGVTVLLIVVITFLMYPINAFVNAISMLFVQNEILNAYSSIIPDANYIFFLLTIAVVPAFLEEMTYRGVMLSGYRKSGIWKGILMSALLFALLHLNLNQFMYAFVFGVFMAVIVEVTGSVKMSVLVHFLINGINMTSLFLLQSLPNQNMQQEMLSETIPKGILVIVICFYGVLAIGCVAAIIAILHYIAKREGRETHFRALNLFVKERPHLYVKAKAFSIPLLIAFILSGYVIISNLFL